MVSGTVVVADLQTAGRGRHGRSWFSPEGMSLYASILIKKPPANMEFMLFQQIACLAIFRSMKSFGLDRAWIKWPNDVYVGKCKIAGVLSECTTSASGIEAIVVGLGVNTNMDNRMLARIDKPATSIFMETQRQVTRDKFLNCLIGHFNSYCRLAERSSGDSIYRLWKAASGMINREITLTVGPGKIISGKVVDLNPDGSILVESGSGERNRFISGDVSLSL